MRVKRLIVLILFCIVISILGDLIFLLTDNRLLANWGAIIVPSLLIGYYWNYLLGEYDYFKRIIPISLVITKVILSLISVSNLHFISVFGMVILYYLASRLFIVIGIQNSNKKNTIEEEIESSTW